MIKPRPDVLFLIRARIDSGSRRGAPQLRKDVQVLKKAEAEIERLRADLATFRPQTPERQPDPGQQWKCGDEFLPFHPEASHVPPDYRDGWNRCYWMAMARGVTGTSAPKPPKCSRCGGEGTIDQTGYGEYRPCPDCNPASPYYEPPTAGVGGTFDGRNGNGYQPLPKPGPVAPPPRDPSGVSASGDGQQRGGE